MSRGRVNISALFFMMAGGGQKKYVAPHAVPIRESNRMWDQSAGWSFHNEQLQYNGTGSHLPSPCLTGRYQKSI